MGRATKKYYKECEKSLAGYWRQKRLCFLKKKKPTQSKQRLRCQSVKLEMACDHYTLQNLQAMCPKQTKTVTTTRIWLHYVPHRSESTLILTQFQYCVKCTAQGIATLNSCNFF
jgi:hypothetical protein